MPKRTCDYHECDNEIPDGRGSKGGATLCDACLSVRGYWRKQGPKALEGYRARLVYRTGRVDYLAPYVGKLIKQARAVVAAAHARASTKHH